MTIIKPGGVSVVLATCWAVVRFAAVASGGHAALLADAERDLAAARAAMAAQRENIAQERRQLNARLDALQADVVALRARDRSLQEADAHSAEAMSKDRRRLEAREADRRSVIEHVTEFRRSVETRMSAPQRLLHRDLLDAVDASLAAARPESDVLDAVTPVLRLARALALDDTQPRRFAGEAVDSAGRFLPGEFVRIGPMNYFRSGDGRGGVIVADANGLDPLLAGIGQRGTETRVNRWFAGGEQTVPVDVSDGALLRIAAARPSFMERMRQGGVVMFPLLLLGAMVAGITIWRYRALAGMDVDIDPVLTGVLDKISMGDDKRAEALAASAPAPWQALLLDAIRHRDTDHAHLEDILQDHIVMLGSRVTQHLVTLSICAAAAPLLGLLGTVTGMIHTFQLITIFGTGDARALSGGISEALVTTQFGLIIAVPALLAHAYLNRKAKRIITGMEQAAIRFVRQGNPGGGVG